MSNIDDTVHVLHVSDESDLVDMPVTFLERENDSISVVIARGASQGLDHIAENEIDCVISEFDMSGQNEI